MIWPLVVMAAGMGLTMAPATDSIMGSLPLAKAGVGSAVNDTTRQAGGALGVAVIGSVLSSTYGPAMDRFLAGKPVPPEAASAVHSGIGGALQVASNVPAQLDALARGLAHEANLAFVDGLHAGVMVGAVMAVVGAVVVAKWLPARARREDVESQLADYGAELASAGVPAAEVAAATALAADPGTGPAGPEPSRGLPPGARLEPTEA